MTHFPPQPGEVQCDGCRYFQDDDINPGAGMGRCMAPARHGYFFPLEWHFCPDRAAAAERDE